jgi:hypothetical protein
MGGDQIGGQNQDGFQQIEKDQAFLKFMHFVLETQEKNTYIYRYHICKLNIYAESSSRTTPIRANTS